MGAPTGDQLTMATSFLLTSFSSSFSVFFHLHQIS
ncbi:hypothetical protein Lser_V15G00160 [Lactuca serriola]